MRIWFCPGLCSDCRPLNLGAFFVMIVSMKITDNILAFVVHKATNISRTTIYQVIKESQAEPLASSAIPTSMIDMQEHNKSGE